LASSPKKIGDAYGALVISGIEEYLRKNNYFFLNRDSSP